MAVNFSGNRASEAAWSHADAPQQSEKRINLLPEGDNASRTGGVETDRAASAVRQAFFI